MFADRLAVALSPVVCRLVARVVGCGLLPWCLLVVPDRVSAAPPVIAAPVVDMKAVPSGGSGGPVGSNELVLPTPGFETDPRFGQKTLIVYGPSAVHAGPARPVILLLHGTAGSPQAAIQQARNVRTFWQPIAEQEQIVLVAPTASGPSGGWEAPIQLGDRPTDYDVMDAALDYAALRYNIDLARVFVWGFSSGGHVTLDLGLNVTHTELHRDRFAGFAVNAGVMEGLACPPNDAAACWLVAESAPLFPLSTMVGISDPLLPRAQSDVKRLGEAGWRFRAGWLQAGAFAGGHTILTEHPAWHWAFLRQKALPAAPVPAPARTSPNGKVVSAAHW